MKTVQIIKYVSILLHCNTHFSVLATVLFDPTIKFRMFDGNDRPNNATLQPLLDVACGVILRAQHLQ